ncbi:hypothetical protein MFLAVUS_010432 [Mucor flavus]|uniref:WRKY domain-containing protein n=1 Tax=Mucor flavus TaxID=439312 RepID=A0ABP9ZCR5_9FUNG
MVTIKNFAYKPKYYQCHRAETAKFQVSFDPEDRDNATIKYAGEHNHAIGSFENTKHLTLSSALRELIESQLSLGYNKRNVRVTL